MQRGGHARKLDHRKKLQEGIKDEGQWENRNKVQYDQQQKMATPRVQQKLRSEIKKKSHFTSLRKYRRRKSKRQEHTEGAE